MSSVIAAITKFQNIALITTAGAVGYWYYQDPKSNLGKQSFSSDAGVEKSGKEGGQGHTLTGDVVDKDKQVSLCISTSLWKLDRLSTLEHVMNTITLYRQSGLEIVLTCRGSWLEPLIQTVNIVWIQEENSLDSSVLLRKKPNLKMS